MRSQGRLLIEKYFQIGADFTGDLSQYLLQAMVRKRITGAAWLRHYTSFDFFWGVCCHCYEEANEGLLKEVMSREV
jgi:hypothetical protein